jgi:hypothetical protein
MSRFLLFALIAGVVILPALGPVVRGEEGKGALTTIKIGENEGVNPKEKFASYYSKMELAVEEPKVEPYELPLDTGKVGNFKDFTEKVKLNDAAMALLKKNGFAVAPYMEKQCADITAPYERLKDMELPVFVTSDTLLHLYHIQFDETLKGVEEREFYPDIVAMTKAMYDASLATYNEFWERNQKAKLSVEGGQFAEALRLNPIFFAVALSILEEQQEITVDSVMKMAGEDFAAFLEKVRDLSREKKFQDALRNLQFRGQRKEEDIKIIVEKYDEAVKNGKFAVEKPTEFPEWAKTAVEAERKLIDAHEGFGVSPLFKYKEDYSQYVPRGHYTRSFVLQKYFKAMMWYGRMTFLLKGAIIQGESADQEAKIQTLQAALISGAVNQVKVGDKTAADVWNRIYMVTAYYVGLADDLTIYEYREVMRKVYGGEFAASDLLAEQKWFDFRKELALLRPPAIYSGTGNIALEKPPGIANEEDLKKALEDTKGLRFMGQRYIPDSYMMGKLVYPTIGAPLKDAGECFTLAQTPAGPARGFPRGLDVMAILGSARARVILDAEGDSKYEKYDETMKALQDEFGKFTEAEWNRNLYWSWLYCLKALMEPAGKGTQSFMQTEAWTDKQLNASLASWAELRHDTILYAKQSYTLGATGMPVEPKMVEGYVEPVPAFYLRMLQMTQMTTRGLEDMKALDDQAKARLKSLEDILKQLLDISVKELKNEKLTKEEYDFIRNFADSLDSAVAGLTERGKETTLIADVHTDTNTGQCLEEGVGYVKMLVVVYRMPDGGLVVGAGPALSYHEFKQPMADRLTDEKWKEMLGKGEAPGVQKWAGSFMSE